MGWRVEGLGVRVSCTKEQGAAQNGRVISVAQKQFVNTGSGFRIPGLVFRGTSEPAGWGPDGASEVPAWLRV